MCNKVLHIANWYPSESHPKRALWIRDQIELWKKFTDVEIWHVEFVPCPKFQIEFKKSADGNTFILGGPLRPWLLVEIITFLMLTFILIFKVRIREYKAINFHIAYPLLAFWHCLAPFIKLPVYVSEHWSAYHFHFNTSNPLKRIRRIFENDLKWIVVSKALGQDLVSFSENPRLNIIVVPNVVDLQRFDFDESAVPAPDAFFMLSLWKDPKDPLLILKVFKDLGERYRLRVGGYGPKLGEMKAYVQANHMSERVDFLGPLGKEEIRKEMNSSQAFIHCSKYETFSVVCAEAISCGCPVLASNVGGVREFINSDNGLLVKEHLKSSWIEAIEKVKTRGFDRNSIAFNAHHHFALDNLVQILKSEFQEL